MRVGSEKQESVSMNWRVSKIITYTLGENLDGI
jgi:hypothetical protein